MLFPLNCAKSYCVNPGLLYPTPIIPGSDLPWADIQQSKKGTKSLEERAPCHPLPSSELSKALHPELLGTQEARILLHNTWKMRFCVPSNLLLLICNGNRLAIPNTPSFLQFSLGLRRAQKENMRKPAERCKQVKFLSPRKLWFRLGFTVFPLHSSYACRVG